MPNIEKIIAKMQRQPNGIRFQELQKVLESNGYKMKTKQARHIGSLLTICGDVITIKEDNPLKAVYVKDVLKRIEK